jgi:hypothetical protein
MNKLCRYISYLFMVIIGLMTQNCNDTPDDPGGNPVDPTKGILEIDFKLPPIQFLSKLKVHRVLLCLGYNEDSIYRSLFFDCANTSDVLEVYTFNLAPGTYYYQAGISCSALGDTCSWAGFPGGRYGIRYSVTRVQVEAGKKTTSSPGFQ